jgi:hypothetical protein
MYPLTTGDSGTLVPGEQSNQATVLSQLASIRVTRPNGTTRTAKELLDIFLGEKYPEHIAVALPALLAVLQQDCPNRPSQLFCVEHFVYLRFPQGHSWLAHAVRNEGSLMGMSPLEPVISVPAGSEPPSMAWPDAVGITFCSVALDIRFSDIFGLLQPWLSQTSAPPSSAGDNSEEGVFSHTPSTHPHASSSHSYTSHAPSGTYSQQ